MTPTILNSDGVFPTKEVFQKARMLANARANPQQTRKLEQKKTKLSHSFLLIHDHLYAIAKQTKDAPDAYLVGEGGINFVTYCQREDGHVFVLKSMKKSSLDFKEKILQSENVLKRINRLKDQAILENRVYKILDYVKGQDLNKAMHSNQLEPSITLDHLFLKLAWSLKALHDKDIIHADLKTDNIIFHPKKVTCIDFDGSVILPKSQETFKPTRWIFNKKYAAPEVIQKKFLHKKSDIFGLGKIFHTVLSHYKKSEKGSHLKSNIAMLIMGSPPSDPYPELIKKMLSKNYKDRPTIDDMMIVLQAHGDLKKDLQYKHALKFSGVIFCFALLASTLLSSTAMLLLSTPLLLSSLGYLRQKIIRSTYENMRLSTKKDNLTEFDNLLELSESQRSNLKVGYQAASSLKNQALTWLYPGSYHKAYYVGLRMHDLAPQIDFKQLMAPRLKKA